MTKINLERIAFAVILVAIAIGWLGNECSYIKKLDSIIHNAETSRDSLTRFSTKSGGEGVKVETQTWTTDQLKNLQIPELAQVRKDIANLGLKLSNVKAYSSTSTITHGEVTTQPRDTVVDTVKAEAIRYDNPWMSIRGYRKDKTTKDNDTLWHLSYTISDTLVQTVGYTRTWFLAKRHAVCSLTAKNPATKIPATKFIEVNRSHPWWQFWKKD